MKVLLLENISAVAVEQFRAAGYEVESLKAALEERELIDKIRGVSILGVRSKTRVSAAVLEAASVGGGKSPLKPTSGLNGAPTLADALKSLKQGVARRLIGDAEHFWQKRYYDFNVRDHAQFVEKLHYIHWNPVRRGLCLRPEDWVWSSFLHYATGGEGLVEIESEWTARRREREAGRLCPGVEMPHSSQKQA